MSSTYLLPDKVIFTDSRAQNLGISGGGGVAIMQLITEMLMVLMAKIMKMAMMLL